MTEPVRRKWRGVEATTRTMDRRERLLGAAIELLGDGGIDATTVRAVCAKAELHTRYFYESFDSLDNLLAAVFDRLAGEVVTELLPVLGSPTDEPRAHITALAQAIVRIIHREPRTIRIMVREAARSPVLFQRRTQLLQTLGVLLEHEAHRYFDGPPPDTHLGSVVAHFLVGGVAETFLAWSDGRIEGTVEALAHDATEVVLGLAKTNVQLQRARANQANHSHGTPHTEGAGAS